MIKKKESQIQASAESPDSRIKSDEGKVEHRAGTEATLVRAEETMFRLFLRRFKRHRLAVASALVLLALAGVCFIVPVFVSVPGRIN